VGSWNRLRCREGMWGSDARMLDATGPVRAAISVGSTDTWLKAGGHQDRSGLAGSVLVKACCCRFRERDTLERSASRKPPCWNERRCAYAGCDKPSESGRCHRIRGVDRAWGNDWIGRTVSVLCDACYTRFKSRGTLERSDSHKPLSLSERLCTNAGCDKRSESSLFHDRDKRAGGKGRIGLAGSVMCKACYNQFIESGTLERVVSRKALDMSERRCTYAGCDKPTESGRFCRIHGDKEAGGKDWIGLAGSVLCDACCKPSKRGGTLERCGRFFIGPREPYDRRRRWWQSQGEGWPCCRMFHCPVLCNRPTPPTCAAPWRMVSPQQTAWLARRSSIHLGDWRWGRG